MNIIDIINKVDEDSCKNVNNSPDQNNYDPTNYDPNDYNQADYNPNNYDPNDYDPNDCDPNDYNPNDYNPNDSNNEDPNDHDPNDYIKEYTHFELDTYQEWIKNILPNFSGAHYIRHTIQDNQEYKLNETYQCHCAGKPRVKTNIVNQTTTHLLGCNNPRPIQKPSKKVGCKSYLRVLKCRGEEGNSVRIVHYILHNGHSPGTDEDLRNIHLSQAAKEWVRERAKDGMKPAQIVSIFHQHINRISDIDSLNSLPLTQKRDAYLSYIDVYNIVRDEMKDIIFLGNNDQGYSEDISVKEWITLSQEDGSHTCNNLIWGSELGYLYGFQTEFQRKLLKYKSAQTICIDGTYGTISHNTHLFTIIIRDNDDGQGVPVAHLISEKKASRTLIYWLTNIKDQNKDWEPHTFLTDCDDAQQNAIGEVFSNARILLCQWHVKNAWQKNKGKIKADGDFFEASNDGVYKRSKKQVAQKVALNEFSNIMQLRDTSQVQNKLNDYFAKWVSLGESVWAEYLKKEYFSTYEKWVDAYRLYEHQEMNTTNYIESWHKKLKYTYLNAKQNHQIDTLIWILRAALTDAKFECRAVNLMIGRMKPCQKEQRHRELASQDLESFAMPGGHYYYVKSSTNDDINYEVNIKNNVQENINLKPAHFECTCPDYKLRGIACKHIFSVCKKYYPAPVSEVSFLQDIEELEPEDIVDVSFDDWVSAIRKVWDKHDQADRNQMTAADLEAIVNAGMKRKSKVAIYDKCPIPGFEVQETNYSIERQKNN